MASRRFVVALLVIAAGAFALRAAYILTVTRHETAVYDNIHYINQAKIVGGGEGFVTLLEDTENADHPPLTVIALAPVARFTGNNETAMRFAVAMAGVTAVVLVGLLGRAVAGPRVGLLAAGIAALYPNLWANDGLVMSEAFAAATVAATILLAYRLARAPSMGLAATAGGACGLAMLARSELALLLPLVVLPALLRLPRLAGWRRLRLAAVTVVAAVVIVSPWVVYNLARFDERVLLSTGDGPVLAGANCDAVYGGELLGFWDADCARDAVDTDGNRARAASEQRRQGLEYLSEHTTRLPVVVAARLGRTFSAYRPLQMFDINEMEGRPRGVSLLGLVAYWALVPLAVFGAVLVHRGRVTTLLPLLGPVVLVALVTAATYGIVRFRVPAEVSLVVLGAVGADGLLARAGAARPA